MSDETLVLEESQEYDLIPRQILEAKLAEAKIVTTKMIDDDGKPVKQISFKFILEDEPYKDRWVYGETSTRFTTHEKCKLRAWVTEIMAVNELPPGFQLHTRDGHLVDIEGTFCRVLVDVKEWESKKEVNEDGTPKIEQRNRVTQVLRSRSASASASSAPSPDEEPFG